MSQAAKGAARQPDLAHASIQGRIAKERKRVSESLMQALARAVQHAVPIAEKSEGPDAAARLTSALQALQAAIEDVSRAIDADSDPSRRISLLEGLHRAMWNTANVVSMADRKIVRHALQSSRTKAPSDARRQQGDESRRLLDDAVYRYAEELGIPLKAGIKFSSQHREGIIAKLPASALEGEPSPDMIKKSIQRVKKRLAESRAASSI